MKKTFITIVALIILLSVATISNASSVANNTADATQNTTMARTGCENEGENSTRIR